MKVLNLKSDRRVCIFIEIQHKELIRFGFSATFSVSKHFRMMLYRITFIIIIKREYLLLYIWSKMLSSSQDVLLKLSETTSPPKRIPTDCITLYIAQCLHSPLHAPFLLVPRWFRRTPPPPSPFCTRQWTLWLTGYFNKHFLRPVHLTRSNQSLAGWLLLYSFDLFLMNILTRLRLPNEYYLQQLEIL